MSDPNTVTFTVSNLGPGDRVSIGYLCQGCDVRRAGLPTQYGACDRVCLQLIHWTARKLND